MSVLKPGFVERHSSVMAHIPGEWSVGSGHYYQLNLRMCQIKSLDYGFAWGKSDSNKKSDSIIEEPQKIIDLNVSLNDLESLEHSHLGHFSHLRALNASLNRIDRYMGIATLKYLRHLDLSHNQITTLHGLDGCPYLIYLNLTMNLLESLSSMPPLGQLREVHVNNNKLRSLDGVQALPQLRNLQCQRNKLTDIIPLASSLRLQYLNGAENQISSLSVTVDVLKGLHRLQTIILQGNPLNRNSQYQNRLVEGTKVSLLDNKHVRPPPTKMEPTIQKTRYAGNLMGIKETTERAFAEHLTEKRQAMEENVAYLQKRILSQKQEFEDYEQQMNNDLENCLSYLDSMSVDEARKYSSDWLHDRVNLKRPPPKDVQPPTNAMWDSPGQRGSPPLGHKYNKPDYRDIKSTDEVLRHTYNELSREQNFLE